MPNKISSNSNLDPDEIDKKVKTKTATRTALNTNTLVGIGVAVVVGIAIGIGAILYFAANQTLGTVRYTENFTSDENIDLSHTDSDMRISTNNYLKFNADGFIDNISMGGQKNVFSKDCEDYKDVTLRATKPSIFLEPGVDNKVEIIAERDGKVVNNLDINYRSKNSKVVAVHPDGSLTPASPGMTTITANFNTNCGYSAHTQVEVYASNEAVIESANRLNSEFNYDFVRGAVTSKKIDPDELDKNKNIANASLDFHLAESAILGNTWEADVYVSNNNGRNWKYGGTFGSGSPIQNIKVNDFDSVEGNSFKYGLVFRYVNNTSITKNGFFDKLIANNLHKLDDFSLIEYLKRGFIAKAESYTIRNSLMDESTTQFLDYEVGGERTERIYEFTARDSNTDIVQDPNLNFLLSKRSSYDTVAIESELEAKVAVKIIPLEENVDTSLKVELDGESSAPSQINLAIRKNGIFDGKFINQNGWSITYRDYLVPIITNGNAKISGLNGLAVPVKSKLSNNSSRYEDVRDNVIQLYAANLPMIEGYNLNTLNDPNIPEDELDVFTKIYRTTKWDIIGGNPSSPGLWPVEITLPRSAVEQNYLFSKDCRNRNCPPENNEDIICPQPQYDPINVYGLYISENDFDINNPDADRYTCRIEAEANKQYFVGSVPQTVTEDNYTGLYEDPLATYQNIIPYNVSNEYIPDYLLQIYNNSENSNYYLSPLYNPSNVGYALLNSDFYLGEMEVVDELAVNEWAARESLLGVLIHPNVYPAIEKVEIEYDYNTASIHDCETDNDCFEGYRCDNNTCLGIAGTNCNSIDDCATGLNPNLVCSAVDDDTQKTCNVPLPPTCEIDDDCTDPALPICMNGTCREPLPACNTNIDCEEGTICLDGVCVNSASCTVNGDCINPNRPFCVEGLCQPNRATCESTEDCEEGKSCFEGKCVRLPSECGSDQDCPEEEPQCVLGNCQINQPECQNNNDCGPNYSCQDAVCVESQGCTANSDCPGIKQCVEGVCSLVRSGNYLTCEVGKNCPENTWPIEYCTKDEECTIPTPVKVGDYPGVTSFVKSCPNADNCDLSPSGELVTDSCIKGKQCDTSKKGVFLICGPNASSCNYDQGTKVIPYSAGECQSDNQCQGENICINNNCVECDPDKYGVLLCGNQTVECEVNRDCFDRFGDDYTCTDNICQSLPDFYEVCLPDEAECPLEYGATKICETNSECDISKTNVGQSYFIKVCEPDNPCEIDPNGDTITSSCISGQSCDTTTEGVIKICGEDSKKCLYKDGAYIIPRTSPGLMVDPEVIYRNNSRVIIKWKTDDQYKDAEEKFLYGESRENLDSEATVRKDDEGNNYVVLTGLKGGEFYDKNDEGFEQGGFPYYYQVSAGDEESNVMKLKTLNRFQTIVYFYNTIFGENNDIMIEEPSSSIRGGGPNFYYNPENGDPMTLEGVKFAIVNDRLFGEYQNRLAASVVAEGNEEAVKHLYSAIHDRIDEEDLNKYYDKPGLDFWVGELERNDENRVTLDGVKFAISTSPEFRDTLVAGLAEDQKQYADADFAYQVALKRGGDLEGVEYLTNNFPTDLDKRLQLSESVEYEDRLFKIEDELGRRSAIEELYETIFGRAADAEGVKYWEETPFSITQIKETFMQGE